VSSKILLVLTALPLSLALFAFVLQRRGAGGGGGSVDPAGIGQLAAGGNSRLPGVVLQLDLRSSHTRGGRMHQPGWKYDILNAATPKVNSPRSTKEKKNPKPSSQLCKLDCCSHTDGIILFRLLGWIS
jgi:hypothetical protein